MAKFLLVQDANELSSFKSRFGESLKGKTIVAWSPNTVDLFRATGLKHVLVGDIYDQHFDWRLKEKLYIEYANWTEMLDRIVQQTCAEFMDLEIYPFTYLAKERRDQYFMYLRDLDLLEALRARPDFEHIYAFLYPRTTFNPLSHVLRLYKEDHDATEWLTLFDPKRDLRIAQLPNSPGVNTSFAKDNDIGYGNIQKSIFHAFLSFLKSVKFGHRPVTSISTVIRGARGGKSSSKKSVVLIAQSNSFELNSCPNIKNIVAVLWIKIIFLPLSF